MGRASAIFLGGALGTVLRAETAVAIGSRPDAWPWATFLVNLLGTFALGVLSARVHPGSRTRGLLATGLCGGLTTFSTMQLELLRMLDAANLGLALGYAGASLCAGLALFELGGRLAGRAS